MDLLLSEAECELFGYLSGLFRLAVREVGLRQVPRECLDLLLITATASEETAATEFDALGVIVA